MNFDETCRQIQKAHALAADYEKTLALLRALKAGDVKLGQVEMLADGGWRLAPPPAEVERNGTLPAVLADRVNEEQP